MLIAHRATGTAIEESLGIFPSPVLGSSVNSTLPTSGDVHLYADPDTYHSHRPILYADCEGLDAGETRPFATLSMDQLQITESETSRARAKSNPSMMPSNSAASRPGAKVRRHFRRKLFEGEEVKVQWATDLKKSGREFAVRHLYPRLLYTFSDVIVFVLRNPKQVSARPWEIALC